MTTLNLKMKKTADDVFTPSFATKYSACFDIHAYLKTGTTVDVWSDSGRKLVKKLVRDNRYLLYPNERVLIPTGLIMDIPPLHSVRLHSRSGLAFKSGVVLGNGEGIIDCDYVEPVFILLHNTTDANSIIVDGDRIAQGELVHQLHYSITEIAISPQPKSARSGGFGSTGK
jgi:dUTP pyrophosphatase